MLLRHFSEAVHHHVISIREGDDVISSSAGVIRDDASAIEQIVAHGVDPNQPLEIGETLITPLMFAAQRVPSQCSLAAVRALLRAGAQVNLSTNHGLPLTYAASIHHRELVLELLASGANINAIQKSPAVKRYTALHAACHFGNLEMVNLLISHGAYLNMADITPLHIATQGGHIEAMRKLIICGADVNCRDEKGRAPLHYACNQRKPHCVQLLVDEGADVSVRDSTGLLPAFTPEMEKIIKEGRRKRKLA